MHEKRRSVGGGMPIAIIRTAVCQGAVEGIGQACGVADTVETDDACKTTHRLNDSGYRLSAIGSNCPHDVPKAECRPRNSRALD